MSGDTGQANDTGPGLADPSAPAADARDPRFRSTLFKVLLVQAAALILLWLLQATYHG